MIKLLVNGTKTVTANNWEGIKAFMSAYNGMIDSYKLYFNGNEAGNSGINASANLSTIINENIEAAI